MGKGSLKIAREIGSGVRNKKGHGKIGRGVENRKGRGKYERGVGRYKLNKPISLY